MNDKAGPSGIHRRYDRKRPLPEEQLRHILESEDDDTDDFFPESDEYSTESDGTDSDDGEIENIANELIEPSTTSLTHSVQTENLPTWTSREVLKEIEFKGNRSFKYNLTSKNPIDFFLLFFDDRFLNLIVESTNEYAVTLFLSEKTHVQSRINEWKNLTVSELKTFLGLLILSGIIQLPKLTDYWSTHRFYKSPFSKYMSRNRFLIILRCLHFTINDIDNSDRLCKIRPVMDHFNEKMQKVYTPGKELSLDESMVAWRGRLIFKQYIKNKRHKYGVKLYVLSEPNGLVQRFAIYSGGGDITSGPGHTTKIVLHLLEDIFNLGHSIYMDRFYNSYELAVQLLEQGTYCTGTLDNRRKSNPKEITREKLKKDENKSLFYNNVHVGKWKDKREVLYISTEFGNQMTETTNKRGQKKLKPLAITKYNQNMSGIDHHDQMLGYYPCVRKSLRWYKKLFVHIMQMSITNAHILHRMYSGESKKSNLSLYNFTLSIAEALLPEVLTQQKVSSNDHKLIKIEKTTEEKYRTLNQESKVAKRIVRKECKGCRSQKIRKATLYVCNSCDGNPGFCVDCFNTYHK